jgi:hypothetical protein
MIGNITIGTISPSQRGAFGWFVFHMHNMPGMKKYIQSPTVEESV